MAASCKCRFFKESSEEEREHAEILMEYQVVTSIIYDGPISFIIEKIRFIISFSRLELIHNPDRDSPLIDKTPHHQ